jgi:hypothetical protein
VCKQLESNLTQQENELHSLRVNLEEVREKREIQMLACMRKREREREKSHRERERE